MEVYDLRLKYVYLRDYYEKIFNEENTIFLAEFSTKIKYLFNLLYECECANLKHLLLNPVFEIDIQKARENVRKLSSVKNINEMQRLMKIGK